MEGVNGENGMLLSYLIVGKLTYSCVFVLKI